MQHKIIFTRPVDSWRVVTNDHGVKVRTPCVMQAPVGHIEVTNRRHSDSIMNAISDSLGLQDIACTQVVRVYDADHRRSVDIRYDTMDELLDEFTKSDSAEYKVA